MRRIRAACEISTPEGFAIGNLYEKEQRQFQTSAATNSKFCITCGLSIAIEVKFRIGANASMTVRTATLQGMPASRSQMRGLLNNGDPCVPTPKALLPAPRRLRRSRLRMPARSIPSSRFPAEAIAAARAASSAGRRRAPRVRRRGRQRCRGCRRLLRARPRLRLDGDDLRHASDQGGVRDATRSQQRLASIVDAPYLWRANAARVLDHRRRQRRRHSQQHSASRAAGSNASHSKDARPSFPTARRQTPL